MVKSIPRILFVDDEPNILQGLKRMLRGMSREWAMDFALGGPAALAAMEQSPADVLVTDMRMPGMDGAELLAKVRETWPQTTRFVLSGHSDQEFVIHAVHAAHQYLTKPCDPELLKLTVSRALRLRALVTDPKVRALISRLNHVPSLPSLYVEITSALAKKDTSVRDIGELVARDIAFSTKLLQLVNSAFFGLPRRVSAPSEAAVLLGTELIRALVLGTKVFSAIEECPLRPEGLDVLWQHSVRTATLARDLAVRMRLEKREADAAFLAGLVHDIGHLVLLQNLPSDCKRCAALVAAEGLSMADAETRVFGAIHELVAASLLGTWGLPDTAVEAVAYMRRPSDSLQQERSSLTAVHLADALDNELHGDEPCVARLDAAYVERLGLTASVNQWREAMLQHSATGDRT